MKITFDFKGSIFGQKEKIILDLPDESTVYSSLKEVTNKVPSLLSILFKDGALRTDILILVDRIDVKAMHLLEMSLEDGQLITILPLAHGG